jgi:hypothetical protein
VQLLTIYLFFVILFFPQRGGIAQRDLTAANRCYLCLQMRRAAELTCSPFVYDLSGKSQMADGNRPAAQ